MQKPHPNYIFYQLIHHGFLPIVDNVYGLPQMYPQEIFALNLLGSQVKGAAIPLSRPLLHLQLNFTQNRNSGQIT